MKKSFVKLVCGCVSLAVVVSWFTAPPARAEERREMFYVVMAHPDDEIRAWPMIKSRSEDNFLVFVTVTRGEGTYSCIPHDQAVKEQTDEQRLVEEGTMLEGFIGAGFRTGAYRYQGPGSPVGERDDAERHPLGNPWAGQGTSACARARIASWHWFLDDMNALDGSGTSLDVAGEDPWLDDDYKGSFCPVPPPGNGHGRADREAGCADVWANADGARVAFDLGNASFSGGAWPEPAFGTADVTAALQTLRKRRVAWGLPKLPESGMLAASTYYEGSAPACSSLYSYAHPEHALIQETLRYIDQGAGPQYGVSACPADDRYAVGAALEVVPSNWATTVSMNFLDPVTEERIGPVLVNYGWLWDTYTFNESRDFYWRVFE